MVRTRLGSREKVFGSDIIAAIKNLVARDPIGLPLALMREWVVNELVILAQMDEDGTFIEQPAFARRAMTERLLNIVANSSVFQAGYKGYEEESQRLVVPVTAYFFRSVYDDSARDCLEAMTAFEIQQSLPKRISWSYARDPETGEVIEDEAVIGSGEVAGIVIFPPNYISCLLIRSWLERQARVTEGSVEHLVDRVDHIRPNLPALEKAKESVGQLGSMVRRALPKPKR